MDSAYSIGWCPYCDEEIFSNQDTAKDKDGNECHASCIGYYINGKFELKQNNSTYADKRREEKAQKNKTFPSKDTYKNNWNIAPQEEFEESIFEAVYKLCN